MPAVSSSAQSPQGIATPPPARFPAIDLLRGLTVAVMILVNNNGGDQAFAAFKHADWNGCTPTDLVFPTFLFLVGVSLVFSTDARRQRGDSAGLQLSHAIRRGIVLCLLGVVVNSFPFFHLDTLRYYGVLQRIGLCYVAAMTLQLYLPSWRAKTGVIIVALLSYWLAMAFVAVPGYGHPGREIPLLDPDRNLVAWVDRQLFSAAHLYERTRDPEGLLSTLPALATTLIGTLAGSWLLSSKSQKTKALVLAAAGIACVVLGLIWDREFPINKKLWTSSYVLFAGGWSLLLLALFVGLVRARVASASASMPAWQTALRVFGTNAIFAYMFSELLAATLWSIPIRENISLQQWLGDVLSALIANGTAAATAYSLMFTGLCWLATYGLYRKRIFIKL